MTTPSNPLPSPDDRDRIEKTLQGLLDSRRRSLLDLEPRALPAVDPVAFQTASSHRAAIEQLLSALARLRTGDYGWCVRCGSAIARERLEVLPQAAACMPCQDVAEAA